MSVVLLTCNLGHKNIYKVLELFKIKIIPEKIKSYIINVCIMLYGP